jgi:hypothetical protein
MDRPDYSEKDVKTNHRLLIQISMSSSSNPGGFLLSKNVKITHSPSDKESFLDHEC